MNKLLKWKITLNYDKYYTGKEILELISKDKLPENHLVRSYYKDKTDNGGVCFLRNKSNGYEYIYLGEFIGEGNENLVCIDFFTHNLMNRLFKIDKDEWNKNE